MTLAQATAILYAPLPRHAVVIDSGAHLARLDLTARGVNALLASVADLDARRLLPDGMVFVDGVAVKRFGRFQLHTNS